MPGSSLKPVAKRLHRLLNKEVTLAGDCIGPEVRKQVDAMQSEEILLLENLRFHKEERENDPEFARELASLCDVMVQDAFGVCHRSHASTEGMNKEVQREMAREPMDVYE